MDRRLLAQICGLVSQVVTESVPPERIRTSSLRECEYVRELLEGSETRRYQVTRFTPLQISDLLHTLETAPRPLIIFSVKVRINCCSLVVS